MKSRRMLGGAIALAVLAAPGALAQAPEAPVPAPPERVGPLPEPQKDATLAWRLKGVNRGAVDTFIGGGIHDAPGAIGSAFNNDTYGYVQKDLRQAVGAKVKAPFSRVYCGDGKVNKCSKMLRETLLEAVAKTFDEQYGTGGCELNNGTQASEQMCDDAVNPTDVTIAPVNEFHWINRPTFQQAVQYQGHR